MTHRFNKQKFQNTMMARGWIMDGPTHSWIRPGNRTMAEAEQNWIDAILEAVECESEPAIQLCLEHQVPAVLFDLGPQSTGERLVRACYLCAFQAGMKHQIKLTTKLSPESSK